MGQHRVACKNCGAGMRGKHKGAVYCGWDCMTEGFTYNHRDVFFDSYAVVGECWEWTGSRDTKNYGRIGGTNPIKAHRLSWELHNGPIPDGLCVLHKCDNPPCVNPAHLFIGTIADNNRDKMVKGRHRYSVGSQRSHSKLTESDIPIIRAMEETHTEIARLFGISRRNVGFIKDRKTWKHVT